MLLLFLLLAEFTVRIASLQLVALAACYISREYAKAVIEVARDALTIAESIYATRPVVPTRV